MTSAGGRRDTLPRPQSSILFKVVAALVLVLLVSGALTFVLADRLTGNALASQARQLAKGHLTVLQEAYSERERTLVVSMRNLAETLNSRGLTDSGRRTELIAELGRASGNLELDLLLVLDSEGRQAVPSPAVGNDLGSPAAMAPERLTPEPASRLIADNRGQFVQAVPMPVGTGANRLILIGGYEFSDAFAYRLRRQIGSLDNVILVASGKVAGSSLPDRPTDPPGQRNDGSLPRSPSEVRLPSGKALVAYVPVGRSPGGPAGGALGVALVDPIGALNRSLAQVRLAASVALSMVALALGWLLFRALIRPLVRLSATAERIAHGDLDASFSPRGHDEIAMLAGSLEQMRVELQTKLDLIAQQAAELQKSSQRIVTAQDQERHRVAHDLHDGIQQQLVVMRMQVGMLQDGAGNDPALEDLGLQLDRTIEQLREVTHDLYPSILLDRGLGAALHSYIGRLPVTTKVTFSPDAFPRLPPGIESGAYFLLCEAVTNALKHSEASEIAIDLRLHEERLELTVADNGRGFEVGTAAGGEGVLHMEDRVRSFGGNLSITSEPGKGTRVVAVFPVDGAADASPGPVVGQLEEAVVTPRSAGERTAPPPHDG